MTGVLNEDLDVVRKLMDPVSVLKEITKLVSEIKKSDRKKLNEINELKQLRLLISDNSAVRSVTACQGLLALVEDGAMSPMQAISMLVSAFGSVQNYSGVTAALAVLLRLDINNRPKPYKCPFSLYAVQHPLITLLKQKKETWMDVFRLVQNFLFNSESSKEESISLLKPLLLYVLCDPDAAPHLPPESRQKTWALMLQLLHDSSVRQLVIQSVPWFQILEDSRCVEAGMLLLDLCDSALGTLDGPLCLALAPLAAASVRILVTRGADPVPCLAVLIRLLRVSPNAASCAMLLLADSLTACPATFLAPVIKCCRNVFELHACSQVSVYSVVSSLLPWLASPSLLTRDALKLATEFLLDIRQAPPGHWSNSTSRLCANSWFRILRHSFQFVHEAAELCRINESWRNEGEANEWLKLVKTSSTSFLAQFSPFFCSILMCGPTCEIAQENDLDWPALSTLLWLVDNQPNISGRVTLTLLYQLVQEKRPLHQLSLLRAIAIMGKNEQNMILILSVFKSLASGGCYSSTSAIDLYLRLWRVQPRAYRFLHELLTRSLKVDDADLMWELNVAKAAAIKEICLTNPDAHGSELVPVLSQLLTQCAAPEGSVASALAIQSITSLCKAGIMDVASTWRGLAPKLLHDNRPRVVLSLCELLSVVSCLPTTTGKYDDFISDVIASLWGWAQHTNGDIACAALNALADFHLDQLTLKGLPAAFRKNLKLPASFCKTPIDAKKDPVDVLPYIPGDCWKQILEVLGCKEDRREAVCDTLASWLRHEIKLFHRGLYNQLPSKPEPTSYEHLHESSILRAMFSIAYVGKEGPDMSALAISILAKDFPRPLPPVTWSFLEKKMNEEPSVKNYCLKIIAKQSKSSPSANRILLIVLSSQNLPSDIEDCKILFHELTHLARGVSPNNLHPFVEKCLAFAEGELRSVGSDLLKTFVGSIKLALCSKDIHEDNALMLASMVEKLIEKVDLSNPVFEVLVDCLLVLPSHTFHHVISPSLWWETSPQKLLSAVAVSTKMALVLDLDIPLAALNECIDICTSGDPKAQLAIFKAVIDVAKVCRHHESTHRWFLQMLGRIQAVKTNQEMDAEQKLQILQYFCDLLMVTTIALAGHDVLVGKSEVLVSSSQDRILLFPQALLAVLNTNSTWQNLSTQVIEWLHDMSIAPEVPSIISQTFRLAITPLRYHPYFKKSNVWMHILSS